MTWVHIEDLGPTGKRWDRDEREFWDTHFQYDLDMQKALNGGSVAVRSELIEQFVRVLATDGYKVTILGEAP